ncbi:MAG TPA: response regulator [Bryobacteraceae bacterium]|jgi:CheY-like chemotaxis protein
MNKASAGCEILLAEDNAADITLVREALREHRLDCALHVMRDGAQAIAFLERLDADPGEPRLDLVLVDMHLPKRDGEDILRRLRSTERYAQTPVIVMTASDSPDDRQRAEKHAALHYFRKPSSLTEFIELGAIVRSILGGPQGVDPRFMPSGGTQ